MPDTRSCDRPNCYNDATHHHVIGGEELDGWVHLCCHHADQMMAVAAISTDPLDGMRGWIHWLGLHTTQCPNIIPGHPATELARALLAYRLEAA